MKNSHVVFTRLYYVSKATLVVQVSFHCALSCGFVKYLNQTIRRNRVLLEATHGTLVVIANNAVTVLAERVLAPLHATLSGNGHALWESCYGNGSVAVFAVINDWT